jgi:glyoxylase-like metal-dependent hydrolase (beta-lactamase superfamily II)
VKLSSPAPGVWRAGDALVNFYIVADGSSLTLVDAGLPGHWDQFAAAVSMLGRSLSDVRAVLVTHAHPDHSGVAERIRGIAGARVWVHALDAPTLTVPPTMNRVWESVRDLLPYLRYGPKALRGPLHLLRNGAFRLQPVREVATFGHDQELDVPGGPRAIHVPGHTPGSSAFVFERNGVLFTGDALVTADTAIGKVGPRVLCGAFTLDTQQALLSLHRLAASNSRLILPGHGEPWAEGAAEAVRMARQAGTA